MNHFPAGRFWLALTLALAATLSVFIGGCVQQRTSVDELILATMERDQGRRDLALARLTAAIERNPQLGLAYLTRGEIYKEQGDYQSAAGDFEKATRLEPFNFNAHYQLGLMYQYLKKFTESIKAYKRAVEIRPLDPDANMNLAIVYSQTGDPVLGLKFAQAAVNGAHDNAMARANLGAMYAQLGYTDLAIAEYKRAIEINSKLTEVYLNLANEYLRMQKYEQARQVLETAAALANSPAVSERLGFSYYKLRRYDQAYGAYEDALKLSPSYFQALNGLGVVAMTKALATQPPDVELGKQAIDHWRRSLQVEANQPVIRQLVAKYAGAVQEKAATTQTSANQTPAR